MSYAPLQAFHTCPLILGEVYIISILNKKELLCPGHRETPWQGWDLHPGVLDSDTQPLFLFFAWLDCSVRE
jgi:hypothetical protein